MTHVCALNLFMKTVSFTLLSPHHPDLLAEKGRVLDPLKPPLFEGGDVAASDVFRNSRELSR